MNWKERIRYQASWGDWYVQIEFEDGQIIELKFDNKPTNNEIDVKAKVIWESMQPPASTIELEAEDGKTV